MQIIRVERKFFNRTEEYCEIFLVLCVVEKVV